MRATKFFKNINDHLNYHKDDPSREICPKCKRYSFRSWLGLTLDDYYYTGYDCFKCGYRIDYKHKKIDLRLFE